jgi:hypothetical protein
MGKAGHEVIATAVSPAWRQSFRQEGYRTGRDGIFMDVSLIIRFS